MKSPTRCLIACAVLLGVAGMGVSAAPAGTIKVGVLLPLTGTPANFGEMERRSIEMATEEINAKGGVKGNRIELIFEDDTGNPAVGRSAVEKLISRDGVPIITGGYSSSVTAAAVGVAQQFKVPFLITSAAADEITEKGYDHIFRIGPTNSEYPLGVVSFLKENVKDVRTAVILYEDTLFGQSGSRDFERLAKDLGIQVILKEGFRAGSVDFKPMLTRVRSRNPDLVYAIAYIMDASLIMRQSKELDFHPKPFIGGGGGFTLPEFPVNAGAASEYVYAASLWTESVPYKGARAYYDKYLARYKQGTSFQGAEAYAAMYVIANALERAKSASPGDLRDALADTNLMTAFGPVRFISYEKKTQQNRLPTYAVQWQKGKLETVWPEDVATSKFIYPVPKWNERR